MKVDQTKARTEPYAIELLKYPRLSTVAWEKIQIGDPVQSLKTGRKGFIEDKISIEDTSRKEDHEISVAWENGKRSTAWYFNFQNVAWLVAI